MTKRREFIKKTATGAAAIAIGGVGMTFSSKSYARIIGANDRLNIAFIGCGRRVPGYYGTVIKKENNVDLLYICDVMQSQRERVAKALEGKINNKPVLENDIRKVLDDKKVDAIFNATPDHWHATGAWMAMEAGKHVYLEKPSSHNPYEDELLIVLQKKYNKVMQVGVQQRSSPETIDIIKQIHNGVIGKPYKALTFYTAARGEVPIPQKAAPPVGLDWELFQGPAPRREYMHDTWDYNWHWYGWNWGTAETGNNATHELDVARWAMQVEYPEHVFVDAEKRYFLNDGWTMYDHMDATFMFPGNKIIKWDGNSRNGYKTYGTGRGTIVYGTEGTVYIDRDGYKLFDRAGKFIKSAESTLDESGTALGGGGGMTDLHIINFFNAIRGKVSLNAPIEEEAKSVLLCHLANISHRVNKPLKVNPKNGHILDKAAMKLWKRDYAPGWAPPRV